MKKVLVGVLLAVAMAGCGSGTSASVGSRACIAVASCGLFDVSLNSCSFGIHLLGNEVVSNSFKLTTTQVQCVASAGSNCDAARKCFNNGNAPATCTTGSRSCEGSTLVLCEPNLSAPGTPGTRRYDCANAGLQCITNGNNLDCGTASCAGINASCSGTDLLYCDSNIQRAYPCGDFNATCVTTGLAPHCRGSGAACSQGGANPLNPPRIRCDGAKIISCVDGQEAATDCGIYGLGCFANLNGNAFECAFDDQCDQSYNSTCSADGVLTFCNGGKVDTFSCKSNGYSACAPDNGGRCIK